MIKAVLIYVFVLNSLKLAEKNHVSSILPYSK